MSNVIVVTTIFNATESIRLLSRLPGWQVYVAGDKKTPDNWNCPGVRYLSPADQSESGFRIAADLPWNHYCRKMIGYLTAMRAGASVIVDTDDDNLPKPNWHFPAFDTMAIQVSSNVGWVNVYAYFTRQRIWPRGYPLNLITREERGVASIGSAVSTVRVGIWQGLADEDPDVDAVYRLVDNTPCYFEEREPLVLPEGSICPFNSQNTAFRRELFALLYLPAFVTFRFTDILRGLVAQPIMWAAGYRLGFLGATVIQKRNPHDYMKDFESEIPCYLQGPKVVDVVRSAISVGASVPDNLQVAYEALHRAGIVSRDELGLLDAWIRDIEEVG